MSDVKHTAWEACDRGDYGDYDGDCVVVLDKEMTRRVAVVFRDEDARLIAAAPEMLKALMAQAYAVTPSEQLEADRLTEAAIAKASGETP